MKKLSIIFMVIVLIITMFVGCGNKDDKVIKIGVVLPMTGELASYGTPMKIGMEMAINDISLPDSKFDNKYDLIYVDSKADPKTAINGVQKLLNIDKVRYFIGDVSSPVTLALVPIMEKNKTFLLSPGASSPKLSNISPYFVRNYPSSVEESVESANFLYNRRGIEKAAIIYVNSEYGIGLKKMFEQTYTSLGGEIVYSEGYDYGRTDFRNLILKLKSSTPEAIYLGGNQKEMGSFMRQLREAGSDALVISNISFIQPDCINIAGKAANGVIVPVAYYNPSDSSMSAAFEFAQNFEELHNKQPTIPNAVGYDAVNLIAKGIEQKGNEPLGVANYIRNLKNYNGALGEISFTNGDVSMPMIFKIVKNGSVVRLGEDN